MTSPNTASQETDEISLRDLVIKIKEWYQYLAGKWLAFCCVGLIGGAIGFAYAALQKPVYTATLTFALEEEKSGGNGLTGAMGLANSLGIDIGGAGGASSGANLMELMKSRTLIEKALLQPITVAGKTLSLFPG